MAKRGSLPRVLELDYKKWRCGGYATTKENRVGQGYTRLLNKEGYMCCLGQFCSQAGVLNEELINIAMPRGIKNPPSLLVALCGPAGHAANINDDAETTVSEKVCQLRKLFKRHKKSIVLKNFPETVLKEIDKLQS